MDPFSSSNPPGEWVSIFHSMTRRPCDEQALVLKAMGLDHVVTERPDGCHLLVPAVIAARAKDELSQYRAENPPRPVSNWPSIPTGRGVSLALAFALALLVAFQVQSRYLFGVDWTTTGELVAGRLAGEWWRAVTALTLHADAAHVMGNMVFGSFLPRSGIQAAGVICKRPLVISSPPA